ncbi:RagB/SusD family nutrient uptake outer membrane protein [Olivibacter sp. SDN3]|uniref:RagB/SusD family nutrient uptake outer membrane protein n=1 Tax=Olivibacter sp. SDN3 TaxID=2764720 RepID=UPI001651AB5A|nr:RagB/SusD family nutrient uptake outer membrane protein [Olivibacter sp. SDN3]QNL49370.1 RagB/SusD family nutrient uptake outer membrane protein [Olivibacter sp. SDN3]
MKVTKTYKTGITALLLLAALSGCKKLDLLPENSFTELNYWTSEAKVNSILNTAYSQMSNSDYFFSNEGLSDNAFSGRGDFNGSTSIAAGTYDPALGRIKSEWQFHYEGIKTCNLIIENIDQVPMDEGIKNRMRAEARFIRALKHFQLMTWFGDIPLLRTDPTREEALEVSRSPKAEALDFILGELEEIVPMLPTNTSYADADKGRITRGAVIALKARVYLYENRWQDVATTCERLIQTDENGSYQLFPNYEGLFLPQNQNNSEVILDIQYVPEFRVWTNMFDLAPISVGARLNNLAPTQELVDSYRMLNGKAINENESGYNEDDPYTNRDPRMAFTIVHHLHEWRRPDGSTQTIYTKPGSTPTGANSSDEYAPGTVSSPTGYYLRKYYDPTHGPNFRAGLNLILIRYADILLMYAEARNELAQLNQDEWDQSIRALRTRSGFTAEEALAYQPNWTQEDIRQIIRNERRVELAMEGLRIFDIRRWQTAEEVLNGWVHGAKFGPTNEDNGYIRANFRTFDPNRHYLWPIPRDERNLNNNLTQNPGWEN